MSAANESAPGSAQKRREELEAVLDRFEEAWQQGQAPAIEPFHAESPGNMFLLVELIKTDMEFRLKAGEEVRVESYLNQFTDVAKDDAAPLELIAREYDLRRQKEPDLNREEYERRFPQYGRSLPFAPDQEASASLYRTKSEAGSGPEDPTSTPEGDPKAQPHNFLTAPINQDEIGRLAGYRVLKVLGEGGMGIVFEGEDIHLRRKVALKAIKPGLASESVKRRFLHEARALASLKHDNIITIYQVAETGGVPYIAMELLRGESLQSRLKRERKLPLADVLHIGREIAEGLAAAHAAGLVHRDIKPANIWMEERRGSTPGYRIKILDFGLARAAGDNTHLTQPGAVVGTPAYMAPEQARAENVGPYSDLFSLGCVLYRMMTGLSPFKGTDTMSILMSLANDAPVPPDEVARDIPPILSALVMNLLIKDPTQRPSSAQAVADALTAIVADPPSGIVNNGNEQRTETVRVDLPVKRRSWLSRIAVPSSIVILGVVAVAVILGTRRPSQIDQTGTGHPPPEQRVVAAASPLDKLDPAAIPPSERFDWQPKELVAVIGEHRYRHWGGAHGIALCPDGSPLASYSEYEAVVRLWDPKTMEPIGEVPGQCHYICFAPSGKTLAAAMSDRIVMWDLTGGKPIEKGALSAEGAGAAGSITFSPNGNIVAATLWGGNIGVWDVSQTPVHKQVIPLGHLSRALIFSPDSKTLAAACVDGTVRLWDVSGAEIRVGSVLKGHTGHVRAVVFARSGKLLYSGGEDRSVRVWEVAGAVGKEAGPKEILGKNEEIFSLAFTPGDKLLLVGYGTSLKGWDLQAGNAVARFETWLTPVGGVNRLAVAADGQRVYAAAGYLVRCVDLRLDGRPVGPLRLEHDVFGPVMALCGDEQTLAVGLTHQTFGTWDVAGEMPRLRIRQTDPLQSHVVGLYPSQTAGVMAVALQNGTISIWNFRDPAPKQIYTTPAEYYESWANGTRLIAHRHSDETIHVLENDGKEIRRLRELKVGQTRGSTLALAVSSDGKTVASGSTDGTLCLWDLSAGEPRRHGPFPAGVGPVRVVRFAGGTLAVGGEGVKIFRIIGGEAREETTLAARFLTTLAMSPDAGTLVTGDYNRNLIVWDLRTGEKRHEWQFPGPTWPNIISADGRHIITANGNGTIYVLRLASPAALPVTAQ
jgi:serine/threonine protein kinase/WD40 repeat protein